VLLLVSAISNAPLAAQHELNEPQNQPPVAVIDTNAPNPSQVGWFVYFLGHGEDSDGDIVAYNWRSSIDGNLSTEPSFMESGLSAGTHIIYFKVQDDDSEWSEEDTATLEVIGGPSPNDPPTAHIDNIHPNPALEGQGVFFSGHGVDTDGSIVAYNWASSIDGLLSTQASFSTGLLSVGIHAILFEVQDDSSAWSPGDTAFLQVTSGGCIQITDKLEICADEITEDPLQFGCPLRG
jgi:hypothetical protein